VRFGKALRAKVNQGHGCHNLPQSPGTASYSASILSLGDCKMQRLTLTMVVAAVLSGCATQDFVRETVAPVQSGLNELGGRVTAQDGALKGLDGRVKTSEERIAALQQEALARAREAAKPGAEPRFAMSTVLKDDRVKFAFGRAMLQPEGAAELDKLIAKLKADDKPVFLEIQGHTDARGSDALNQRLGQERAEAVRLHLARAGVPLARMQTISYGESAPMADNSSEQGRSQNRRVQLVVMR
jgi:outer membrane protein OmpA-like peptidoglycan-associated protein